MALDSVCGYVIRLRVSTPAGSSGGAYSWRNPMRLHHLSGWQFAKATGVGILTSLILSAIMVTGLKTGMSPMPAPVALVFAQTLLGTKLPLPVGLLFHVAWVTFWSILYIALF